MSALATLLAVPAGNSGGGGHSGGGFLFLPGFVFLVIGTLNATKPELQWRMRRWQYRNKEAWEPSDAALRLTRVIGALFAVIGLALIVTAIVKIS